MLDHQDETRAGYDGVVEQYASMFTSRLETRPFARAMINTFALDTHFLACRGDAS